METVCQWAQASKWQILRDKQFSIALISVLQEVFNLVMKE